MREYNVLPCDALFKKRIEMVLDHIRDNNKFKNIDYFFSLVQCFKTIFCFLWFNASRLLFVSFDLMC